MPTTSSSPDGIDQRCQKVGESRHTPVEEGGRRGEAVGQRPFVELLPLPGLGTSRLEPLDPRDCLHQRFETRHRCPVTGVPEGYWARYTVD